MRKSFLLLSLCSLAMLPLRAQDAFRGAYFMDTYLYGHTMNPAFCANRSYASLGVGNIGLGVQSNLGASTFFYPTNRGTVSFLSDQVPAETFLKKLNKNNTENGSVRLDLLNFGFWTPRNQFHSFNFSINVIEDVSAPKDLFRFLKSGSSDGADYSLAGLGVRSRVYGQLAYGISFPVTNHLRVGGKVKALVGLAYADMSFSRFDVTLTGQRWSVSTQGQLLASNLPATQRTGSVRPSEILDLDNFEVTELRPSGFGAAVDLGVSWDVLPWLQLSASVTDLGLIGWTMDRLQTRGTWEYTGFQNISFTEDNNFQEKLDAKMQELDNLLMFTSNGKLSNGDLLPATFYAGAKFRPNDWFSAGLLGTCRVHGKYSWSEMRAALNLEPCHWFGLSGSAAYGTLGPKFSTLMNLRLPAIAFFAGAELSSPYFISTDPQGRISIRDIIDGEMAVMPRDQLNLSLVVGLNLVFGKKPAERRAPSEELLLLK